MGFSTFVHPRQGKINNFNYIPVDREEISNAQVPRQLNNIVAHENESTKPRSEGHAELKVCLKQANHEWPAVD